MTSLKKQTISGIKWQVASSFLQKAISVGATVVLARILSPSVFGLFALAFVAIDALSMFKSMGFDSALIQNKENTEKAANTAFFIIPALGSILYLILAFCAPLIGRFLNNQDVVGVVKALGVIFVISCFGRVPAALLEKSMQFKKISLIEIYTSIAYSLAAIILALLGMGIWSLVYAYILKTLTQNILFWAFSRWHPRLEFDKKAALEMFHFGKFIFLGAMVWFLKMNLDNLLVGKLLGVAALGLYAIAFNIANFGADYFSNKVHRVIFPAFSKIQADKDDLKSSFLKVTKHVGIFAFPFCAGLCLLSKDLITVVYGQKWIAAAPILSVLAFVGLFNTLPVAIHPLLNALGYSKSGFWFCALQVALFFLFISPAAKLYGLNGVGVVVVLSQLIAVIAYLPFTMKLISLRPKDIYLALKPGLISSLCMAAGILFLKNILLPFQGHLSPYYNFIILSVFALAVYSLSLLSIEKKALRDIKEAIFV